MNTYHCRPGDSKAKGAEGRGLSSDAEPGYVVSEIGLEKESGFIEKLLGIAQEGLF